MKASNPAPYHGQNKDRTFFEGWYYKIDLQESEFTFIVIVGIAMSAKGAKEAFIQFGDSKTGKPRYYAFDASEFSASSKSFELSLGKNYFTRDRVKLNLADLQIDLIFSEHRTWDSSVYIPNIMGPLSYLRNLDCHHNVLSLRNKFHGSIRYNGVSISLDGALGYIEKEWGKSFPKAHIWMQSNTLEQSDLSLSLAIGKMRFLNKEIPAYAALLQGSNHKSLFATYRLNRFKFKESLEGYNLNFSSARYALQISFNYEGAMPLLSPNRDGMKGLVEESLQSEIRMKLKDRFQKVYLIDTCGTASVEIVGNWF